MPAQKTILVLEDDESLRAVVRKVLEVQGYQVISAGDSVAASQAVRNTQDPIHLLLTDINLPGLMGGEFAAFLKSFRPETKVLYMSGEPKDPVALEDIQMNSVGFLQKPFQMSVLLGVVKAALQE